MFPAGACTRVSASIYQVNPNRNDGIVKTFDVCD
jgi:hypothetical protein